MTFFWVPSFSNSIWHRLPACTGRCVRSGVALCTAGPASAGSDRSLPCNFQETNDKNPIKFKIRNTTPPSLQCAFLNFDLRNLFDSWFLPLGIFIYLVVFQNCREDENKLLSPALVLFFRFPYWLPIRDHQSKPVPRLLGFLSTSIYFHFEILISN